MSRRVRCLGWLFLLPVLAVDAEDARADATAEAVVERLFDAFNRHDIDALAALYAADARIVSPDHEQPLHGPEGARAIYAPLFAQFPDIRDEVAGMVVQGDEVAVQFVSRGCDRDGRFCFDLPIASFLTVRDDLIIADTSYFDDSD